MQVKVTGITKKQTSNGTDMWRIEWKTANGKDGGVGVFDPDIAGAFTLGHSYEVELVQKGKYSNLGEYREIEALPDTPAEQPKSRSYGKSPDERASIERQVAVKEVGEALRMGMAVTPAIQEAYWRIVAEWLNAPQSSPAGVAPIPAGIPQPRTSRDDAAEMDAAFAGTVATDMVAGFPNRGAFFAAAYETWKLGPSEVGAIITTADMQDLNKAWEKLARIQGGRNE